MSVEKTNVNMLGVIQPEFIMSSLQHGKDPESLFRRFLLWCPTVIFGDYEDIRELYDECFIRHKMWTVIMTDDAPGSENFTHILTQKALYFHASCFNVKSKECAMLEKDEMQFKIANSSKIRDQALRAAVTFQLIEMSLEFLNNCPNFDSRD